jgi:hypothetical protein
MQQQQQQQQALSVSPTAAEQWQDNCPAMLRRLHTLVMMVPGSLEASATAELELFRCDNQP